MGTPEPFENGYKQVRTNSVEHDAFAAAGWVVVEQDGNTTIMHAPRRADDRQPRATVGDLLKWRRLELEIRKQIAAEAFKAGIGNLDGTPLDETQIQWVLDQYRTLAMREGNGKTVVSGKLR